MECIHCHERFQKRKTGSYARYSVNRNINTTTSVSIGQCLSRIYDVEVDCGSLFICYTCFTPLAKVHRLTYQLDIAERLLSQRYDNTSYIAEKQSTDGSIKDDGTSECNTVHKRKRTDSVQPALDVTSAKKRKTNQKPSRQFRESVVMKVRSSKYNSAIKTIYQRSSRGKLEYLKCVKRLVRTEITEFMSTESDFQKPMSIKTIQEFDWHVLMGQITDKLPILSAVVTAGLTSSRKEDKLSTDRQSFGQLVPTFGAVIAILLYIRNSRRYRFFQMVNSIQMYRNGCTQKLIKCFAKIGFCTGIAGTRSAVDRLTKDYDKQIVSWKTNIQKDIGNFSETDVCIDINESVEQSTVSEESSTDQYWDSNDDNSLADELDDGKTAIINGTDQSCEDADSETVTEKEPGYALCWDNVQKMSMVRHQMSQRQNKMMLWALAFGVKNRISFRNMSSHRPMKRASEILLQRLMPSSEDFAAFRNRCEVVVQRILSGIFDWMTDLHVPEHIEHQYSTESRLRSEIVNLGVVDENPASTKGVTEIMKHLSRYIPVDTYGNPYYTICNGDQLSVERMLEAKCVMGLSTERLHRLEGIVPRPQGFHKRCILMQDTLDMLFSGRSTGDVGTLYQIKNKYGHRQVTSKISECTNHFVDFMDFVAKAMVTLLAMQLMDVHDISTLPDSITDMDRQEKLKAVSSSIVDMVWPYAPDIVHQLTEGSIDSDSDVDDTYCICEPDDDIENDEMIECSAQNRCNGGRWFHGSCVHINPSGISPISVLIMDIESDRSDEITEALRHRLQHIAGDIEQFRTDSTEHDIEITLQLLTELHELDQDEDNRQMIGAITDKVLEAAHVFIDERAEDLVKQKPPLIHTSRKGRPTYNIPEETLSYLVDNCFTIKEMAYILSVSERTIHNRLKEYGLSIRQSYSNVTDNELDELVKNKVKQFPTSGFKTIMGHLKADGHRLQGQRIMESMRRVDPFGIMIRKLFIQTYRIKRRSYNVRAPMSLWHVDTNHKLIRWRFIIHAGIDGFSRLPAYVKVASDNTAATALEAFKSGVNEYGLPERVRTDKGKENIGIAEFMLFHRGIENKSHITGRSVHNQRIERFWREVWNGCTNVYYQLFNHMEQQERILDPDCEIDLLSLHLVYMKRIQLSLTRFALAISRRPLRTENNKTPLQLWIMGQALDQNISLSDAEAHYYGIDFGGPIALDPEEDVVVPELDQLPYNILDEINGMIPDTVDNLFETGTYFRVKQQLLQLYNM